MNEPGLTAEQATALGSPTRQALLSRLADAGAPLSVADLTSHVGTTHNAVRKHLARLTDAGFVIEETQARTTPGRPRLIYRLDPTAPVAQASAYERLAVMLASALRSGGDTRAVGRDAGRRQRVDVDADPVDALTSRLDADGFSPVVRGSGDERHIVLGNCPFAAAAAANPEAVCQLHLGLAEGAAEAVGGLRIDRLVPKDPRRAGCRLDITET